MNKKKAKRKRNKRKRNKSLYNRLPNRKPSILYTAPEKNVWTRSDDLAPEDYIEEELKEGIFDWEEEDEKDVVEKVQIFGTDHKQILPILTDSQGRLKISSNIIIPPISFTEFVIHNLSTSNQFNFTPSFDVSRFIASSFIVVNRSRDHAATVQLQHSPNKSMFEIDAPERTVAPNSFEILTPTKFIRYLRVAFRSALPNRPAILDIYFQAQGNRLNKWED